MTATCPISLLEAEIAPDELRARLGMMSDSDLLEFGRAAASMCRLYATWGHPPRKVFVIQREEARAEWERRHGSGVTDLT